MVMHAGYREIIIFSTWHTTNRGTFAISCIGLFLIGVIFEAIKLLRENFASKNFTNEYYGSSIDKKAYHKYLTLFI